MSLLSLPRDNVQLFFRHYPSFFVTNKYDRIELKRFSVVFASLINQKNPTDCIIVDHVAVNADIVNCGIEAFTRFVAKTKVQSYVKDPTKEKRDTLIDNLRYGKSDVSYAYNYWIGHFDKCNGHLDESTLRLLGELLSNLRALDLVVLDNDEAVPVFLRLFGSLSVRRQNLSTSCKS